MVIIITVTIVMYCDTMMKILQCILYSHSACMNTLCIINTFIAYGLQLTSLQWQLPVPVSLPAQVVRRFVTFLFMHTILLLTFGRLTVHCCRCYF